ncbi:hypothetical protein [Dyella sp. ASV21]|uniref:hypothetical protein n=1 Tax=Dyella sp. ASV21 TaxID=2795114 RepID=UPI0018ECAA51|nr:hypothetical protein [Dyella sp. ASV21]
MKTKKTTGPGHPPTDVASRLRNWAWYWTVKQATGCSDERLDELYLPESPKGNRRRFFQRVRSVGSDPTRLRGDLDGISVFQRIHDGSGAPALQAAERDFKSWLWIMLTQPAIRIEDHQQFINQLLAERGWYRLRDEDRRIVATFMAGDPAFGGTDGRDHVYSAMLSYLETHPTADHVALLAALFREAMTEVALTQAISLRSSLQKCARDWAQSLGMPDVHRRLLVHLIEQRLVHRRWLTTDLALKTYGSQRRYVQALMDTHLASLADRPSMSHARAPIVRRSPRIAWMDAHRHVLAPIVEKLEGPAALGAWTPGDPDLHDIMVNDQEALQAFWRMQEEAHRAWQNLARHAFKIASPPPQDMRYCLPVEPGSQYRNDNRPLPYLDDGHLDTQARRKKRLAPEPSWRHGDAPPPLKAKKRSKK